jgi:accessory colonization factor AcfC
VRDVVKRGLRVMVVPRAGSWAYGRMWSAAQAMWPWCGPFRKQIVLRVANSVGPQGLGGRSDPGCLAAWLIWNIRQKASPELADAVPTDPALTVYRSCGAAVTALTLELALARQFLAFLETTEGRGIFTKWGWMMGSAPGPMRAAPPTAGRPKEGRLPEEPSFTRRDH